MSQSKNWSFTRASGLAALLLAAEAPLQALGADAIQPFEASYNWVWHGAIVAVSTLKLTHGADDTWTYSSTNEPRGLGLLYPMRPALQSTLRITDSAVEPLAFRASGSGASHDANVTFDWDALRAHGNYEGTAVDMPIKPGIQDDLSVQIAMIVQLLQNKTPENLSLIDKNTVREYQYRREGEQTIATPLGKIDTVIYSSQHPGSPRITRFWCAPSKGYLPMQVEQKRIDDLEWRMQIRELKSP